MEGNILPVPLSGSFVLRHGSGIMAGSIGYPVEQMPGYQGRSDSGQILVKLQDNINDHFPGKINKNFFILKR